MFFMLTEWMGGVERYSASGSRGESCWNSLQPNRVARVALEACGGAHHWARLLTQLGHEVRLIPPAYVKPFVKRQKNDAIDAEW
jgi:transposase